MKETGFWWEREPLRIVEIAFPSDRPDADTGNEARMLKQLGANVCHFHCMAHTSPDYTGAGMDDRGFFFKTPLARKANPDRLGEFLPLAHRAGIRVVVYVNVHWYNPDFGSRQPGWVQIREDGSPVNDMYQTGTSFCVNSEYRTWVFQLLRDLCAYDIDGIFYDGPIFHATSCYCASCRRLFLEKTGKDLPKKSDRSDPLWRDLVEFQFDSIERFLADSRAMIKNIRENILFYMNGNSTWPGWPTGVDNRRIIRQTDILAAEGGFLFGDLNLLSPYKPGIAAKFLTTQAQGKPVIVFDCAGLKPWSLYPMPRPEISLLLSETLAGGGNYWLAYFPDDLKQPEIEAAVEYNRIVKENPHAFVSTESLADVALVWPSLSAESYTGSSVPLRDFTPEMHSPGIGDITQEFTGFYEMLARSQVPFDVLDEPALKDLSRYRLLVLPNVACLDPGSAGLLREFVRSGGNVVASFETSLYDGAGVRQERFQLEDLFGAEHAGSVLGPRNWDYISPASCDGGFLDGITKTFLPSPQYGIAVKPREAVPFLFFREKMKGRYDRIPGVSEWPFAMSRQYRKGTVVFFAGTFGTAFLKYRFEEYLRLMKNLCVRFSSMPVIVENAPWVEVNLRRAAGDRIHVHLINMTSGIRRPITSVVPLKNLKVCLPHIRATAARTLRGRRKVAVAADNEGMVLTVPLLKEYDILEAG